MAIVAAMMCIPIVLFQLLGYDINPAFFLVPLIGLGFLNDFDRTGAAYILSMVAGVVSIFAAEAVSPDGETIRHLLSLVLIMFAPSFLFLGRFLAKSSGISRIFFWFSMFSSIFLIVVAARVILLDQAVRIYIGSLGFAAMNAEFLGLPVFATFGVLSLAHLICLQAMILCGTLIGGVANRWLSAVMWLALLSASFLIFGSESRSAQLLLIWIFGSVVLFAFRDRQNARKALFALLALVAAFGLTYVRGIEASRMLSSLDAIKGPASAQEGHLSGTAEADRVWQEKADQFATGRIQLLVEGVSEAVASPLFGNGFSGYGRYTSEEISPGLAANTSTHVYFLTLVWKGGLIFFIPFIAMLFFNLSSAVRRTRMSEPSPERFFAWSAVLMAFGPMALVWDILIVPSAGAVAFFLFGMLGAKRHSVGPSA
ncbi:O-antigen ligase family protein [Halopseudomonas nanhaiensis]|uniref:O-antigen ligase family protein n=1 Tax=Halopseudomonas nanhaiensis TaxID=2830842 RepID=UPI001CBF746E|nr:O-antigen ligase family protein [Halopseudomonas nanhaiensis]UAW99465.1 O-antigen ligase family protein [Halopseudomonas nanhaiensis]